MACKIHKGYGRLVCFRLEGFKCVLKSRAIKIRFARHFKPMSAERLRNGFSIRHWIVELAELLMMLRRMGRSDVTAHGFRSSFRTWAAERTGFPREVVEAALAHVTGNKVEAAYQRGDMFEKRRRLMHA